MAALCDSCNRLIENNEPVCPHCGTLVLKPNENIDDSINSLLDSMLEGKPQISSGRSLSEQPVEPSISEQTAEPYETAGSASVSVTPKEQVQEATAEPVSELDSIMPSELQPAVSASVLPEDKQADADRVSFDSDKPSDSSIEADEVFELESKSESSKEYDDIDGFSLAPSLDSDAVKADEPLGLSELLPEDSVVDADAALDTADAVLPMIPVKKRHALESSLNTPPSQLRGRGTPRLLVAAVILAAVALFSSIVILIVMPMRQISQEKTEMIGFLEGAWISDHFAFYDSTSKSFVEVLTVDGEGNFKMLYSIPDEAYPDGWLTGRWQTEDMIEGHIDYIAGERRLLLLYEQDGANYFFERFFVIMEDDRICLREYYDETNSSFYDVVLHRIKM